MSSPDLAGYVDLSLFDREPEEIVERALLVAQEQLPDWTPRTGNTEVALIEALAVVVAELIYAVNRLPGTVTQVLMRLFGTEPSEGVSASTELTFTLADALGHTIPAGTSVRVALGGAADDLVFVTDDVLLIPAATTSGTVDATATRPTDEANGITAGTLVELLDRIPSVDTVALATDIAGGQGPESEQEWLDRSVQRLQRLVSTLVRPEHFTAAVLEQVDVIRALTVDNYDPDDVGDPGDHPGHVTVAVSGAADALLTVDRKAEIEAWLSDQALAVLAVHVIDVTITDVDVTVTVRRHATHTDAQVQANVEAILEDYLSPSQWEWSATVRRNELIAVIDRAEGVNYVEDLTVPAADVAIGGVAPLARLGDLIVNVTAP